MTVGVMPACASPALAAPSPGLRGEPGPKTRTESSVELEHPLRNEPLQELAGLALLVVKLGIALAGEPGVEEADPDRAEALNGPRQPVWWPVAHRGRWPIAEARRPALRRETRRIAHPDRLRRRPAHDRDAGRREESSLTGIDGQDRQGHGDRTGMRLRRHWILGQRPRVQRTFNLGQFVTGTHHGRYLLPWRYQRFSWVREERADGKAHDGSLTIRLTHREMVFGTRRARRQDLADVLPGAIR